MVVTCETKITPKACNVLCKFGHFQFFSYLKPTLPVKHIAAANSTFDVCLARHTSKTAPPKAGAAKVRMEVARVETIPAEMLERIFRLLPPRDLKTVVLVCRRWRLLGEAPRLWAWVVLTVTQENISYMPEVLAASRLQAVKELVLTHIGEDEKLLQAVLEHQGLKKLEFVWNSINRGGRLLSPCCPAVRKAVQKVIDSISEGYKIKILDVEGNILTQLDPQILADAVCKLEDSNLNYTKLTALQIKAIFTAISSKKNIPLKALNIAHNEMQVRPELLSAAVTKLERLNLESSGLSSDQTGAIFSAIQTPGSRLRSLELQHNDLSSVEPGLLARAVTRLEEVNFQNTEMTTEQLTATLTALSEGHRLRKLRLVGNRFLVSGFWFLDEHLEELVISTIQRLNGVDHDLANILDHSGSEDDEGESSEGENNEEESNEEESSETDSSDMEGVTLEDILGEELDGVEGGSAEEGESEAEEEYDQWMYYDVRFL